MDILVKLDNPEKEPDEEKPSPLSKYGYTNLIGLLMYLAITTRPDIAYSVNKLAQYVTISLLHVLNTPFSFPTYYLLAFHFDRFRDMQLSLSFHFYLNMELPLLFHTCLCLT